MSSTSPSKPVPSSPHPPFSSLPMKADGPPGNAWGRYGDNDQLGTLNLLTPAVVAAAAREIISGIRISLDWPLNKPSYPSYGRDPFAHEIRQRGGPDRVVNDDILTFNTQSSSQWDGFRHYGASVMKLCFKKARERELITATPADPNKGYLNEQRYYNNTTHAQLHASQTLGIDAWSSSGGIVGRGILLDYSTWATTHSVTPTPDPFSSTSIPFAHLQQVIATQNITFRPGDILFIRSGFTKAYNPLSSEEQLALSQRPRADFMGVEPSREVLEWLWETRFAAVAGDAPAFERSPVGLAGSGEEGEEAPGVVLHQWLLGGWGMPIGEMFDLEGLSAHCREVGRWSFFLSSVPLKVPGGVASPPNAVAIF